MRNKYHEDTFPARPHTPASLPLSDNGFADDDPAPRRRHTRSKRRRPLSYPLQLALAVGGVVCAAYLLVLFLGKVVYPYQLGNKVGRDVESTRTELRKKQEMNRNLERRIAYLRTQEGVEREARRAGYHRPGETVYLLQDAPPASDTRAVAPNTHATAPEKRP